MSNKIKGGYRVLYWDNISDPIEKIIHEPLTLNSNKITRGKINRALNAADEFVFELSPKNDYYGKLQVLTGIVKVIDLFDNTIAFSGRIIEITGDMSATGMFYQEIVCESDLGYLNDMTLMFEKRENKGPAEHFEHIINFHNDRVEEHKKFKIGALENVTGSDAPYLYCTFESTWEGIKNRITDKYGGFIVMRSESDGNYIDYRESIGEHKTTPIEIGKNIKTAYRDVNLSEMMTEIVPVGGEVQDGSDTESENDAIRPLTNINGLDGRKTMFIPDDDLIREFGIIRKIVRWPDITDKRVLKRRGEQYLRDQKVALSTWKVSVIDTALIDPTKERFQLGNYHPIINPPLSGVEELQIIEIEIDVLNPQSLNLTIGADSLTISSFQLQQKAAIESMEKVLADNTAQQNEVNNALSVAQQIQSLEGEISALTIALRGYQSEIDSITPYISEATGSFKSYLQDSLSKAQANKQSTQTKINELQAQIDALK